jgi:hypothetical protein
MKKLLELLLISMCTLPLFGEESAEKEEYRLFIPTTESYVAEGEAGKGRIEIGKLFDGESRMTYDSGSYWRVKEEGGEGRKPKLEDFFYIIDTLFVEGPFCTWDGRFANRIYEFNLAMQELYKGLKHLTHADIFVQKDKLPVVQFGKKDAKGGKRGGLKINFDIRVNETDGVSCGLGVKF